MEAVGIILALAVVGFIAWRVVEAKKAPKGGSPDKKYPPSKEQ